MPTGDGKDDRQTYGAGDREGKSLTSSSLIHEVAVDGDRDEVNARGSPPGQRVSGDKDEGACVGGEMNTTGESSGEGGRGISSGDFGDTSAEVTGAPVGGYVDKGTNGASTATAMQRSVAGTVSASTAVGRNGEGVHDAWVGAPLAGTSVATTSAHGSGAHGAIPVAVATAATVAHTGGATVSDATLVRAHDEDNDRGGLRGFASLLLSTLREEGMVELLASPLLWYAVQWARSQNPVFHTSEDAQGDGDRRGEAGEEGDADHHRAGWEHPRGGTTLRIVLGLLAEAVEAHWNVCSLKRDYAEWRVGEDNGEEGEYDDSDGEANGWRNRRLHPYAGRDGASPSSPSRAVRGGAPSTQQPSTDAGNSGRSSAPLIGSARCDGAAEKIMYFLTALECVDPALETWARSLHPLLLCLGARRRVASGETTVAGRKTTSAYHYWNVLCKVEWVKFFARAALLSAENLSRWFQCQQGGQLEQRGGGGQRNFDVTCLRRGGTLPPLGGGMPTPPWDREEAAEMPYHQRRRRHNHRGGNNHHHRQQQNGWHGYYNNENPRYSRRHPRQHQEGWQHHHQQHRHHHQQNQHDRRYHHHHNQHPGSRGRELQHTQQHHRHHQQRQRRYGPSSYPRSGRSNSRSSPYHRKPQRENDRASRGMGNGRPPSDHAPDYVGRRTGRRLGAGAGHSGWNSGGDSAAGGSASSRRPLRDNGGDGEGYGRKNNLAHGQFALPVSQSQWEGRPHSTTHRGVGRNDRDDAIPQDYQTAVDASPVAIRPYGTGAPSAIRPRSRLRLAIAEVLHIARPLIWTALQTRATLPDECDGREGGATTTNSGGGKGIRHTRSRILTKIWPWIFTLAVDIVSLWLMSTCGVGRNAPVARMAASPSRCTRHASQDHDHEGDEGGNEDVAAEARRRRARLWLYLLRSPAWDWATGPATRVAARLVAGAVPLFGLGPAAAGSFLSWLEYWRSNHCVLEGHHHAAA